MNKYSLLKFIPDKTYLRFMYYKHFRKWVSFKNPQTFNEKLQWLKLYDRNPVYTIMVDKIGVKRFVAGKIGEKYVIPTLGVYDSIEDIDFDELPNQFVLKCNHDSKSVCICKDKNSFDIERAKRFLEPRLKVNGYWYGREWPYKNVPRKIIAEKYMEDEKFRELRDYKIYTFNGKAKFCMINTDRGTNTRADYFDESYNWLDFTWGYPHADVKPEKPVNYEKMFELAEKLATGTATLRVDFYEVSGQIYFGELTFFDASGFDKIIPESYDLKFGNWINLPDKRG
ncbi:ATP-grasp fold amidoligase family protein [Ruminococcus sp.]|uniref:ATP-grasp fold amidoligase family protein n=1 Tax=Ruminococcus sp. TaxID=41978 RepID=UPI0025E72BC7|nr:ATP-grasp fold amidoligase family protein [Ruminococcus sp.]